MPKTCFVACFLVFSSAVLLAQDPPQDEENCKDSPLVTRFPGGHINSCEHKEYEEISVRTGTKDGEAVEKKLGGEYWYWDYATREGVSEIQVFRNFETAIRRAGFAIDWSESPNQITRALPGTCSTAKALSTTRRS